MELSEFITNFANQFDETDSSLFTVETKFRELEEWSSIVGFYIISMISDEYDVVVKNSELKECDTVNDVFELVKSKL